MTAALAHNGGRYQIGLNYLQIGNDFPFLNHLKTAQAWTYIDNSGVPTPDELDANGYLKAGAAAIAKGGVYTVFYVPTQAERPGRYKITWTGNGTIYTGMATADTVGSKTGSGGSGSFEFSTTDFRFLVGHTTGGDVSNLKVFHVDDEALVLAGEVFGVKFKERIAESLCGVIRFMDWQPGNTTNVTTWATRRPIDYVFYAGGEFREANWAGGTSNSGDVFTALLTPSSWTGLVDKATVIVKWNASASGDAATLNVAGSGDIPIKDWYGNQTSVGANTRHLANMISTLIYDADLGAWIKHGGDNASLREGINNGVPPELMVQLAAETGCHPYFTTPYLAIDPATDYMSSLAAYCRDNGPAWMIPRFEGTNETWNNAAGFFATRYSWNKALVHWGANQDQNNWFGKTMSVLGQGISEVYSNDRTKYQVIAGVQTVSNPSDVAARLTSALYVAQAAAPQSGYTKSPASDWATHVCCAQYITPVRYGTLQELKDGFAYVVTHVADPDARAALELSYADTLLGTSANYNLELTNGLYASWFAWAQSYGLELTGYEGGYSPDYNAVPWYSPITGATATNPCVLTLATTANSRSGDIAGNPAVSGMSLSITSVGGMTQLNGNTYTVLAVDGNSVTIDVDASGFSAWTSGGTATYVNAPLYTNTLRYASKFAPSVRDHTLQNLNNFINAGGENPAIFILSAGSTDADRNLPIGNGQVWGVWDPTIWAAAPSAAWDGMILFGQEKRGLTIRT